MTTYPQHDALRLPPVELLSDRELAAHLVHDHGMTAEYLNDYDGAPDFTINYLVHATDAEDNERAVAYFTADRTLALVLHSIDHDTEDGAMRHVGNDEDTGTWNDHDHARSPQRYAAAIVELVTRGYGPSARAVFDEDPGGWAAHVGDSALDSADPEDEGAVADAAFALLADDAAWTVA